MESKICLYYKYLLWELIDNYTNYEFVKMRFSLFWIGPLILTSFASIVLDQPFSLPGARLMTRMAPNALGVHLGTYNNHPEKLYNKC